MDMVGGLLGIATAGARLGTDTTIGGQVLITVIGDTRTIMAEVTTMVEITITQDASRPTEPPTTGVTGHV